MTRFALLLLLAVLVGCTKQPATPQGGVPPKVGKLDQPEAGGPDPSADLYADPPAGEEPLDPTRAPVGTPLRPRRTDATFRLGNPRFEQTGIGPFQNLVIDYEKVNPGTSQQLNMMFRLPDGRVEKGTLFAALNQHTGRIAFRQGFGPFDQLPKHAELYLVNVDGRYEQGFQFKVSNSVKLGDVQGQTLSRNWTAVEGTALRNPPPPPKTYLIPNNDPNAGEDTKLVGVDGAPGPFRYIAPAGKLLLGFDYWMASWDNGKKENEPSPGGFTPVFDREQPVQPNAKRVVAKVGYAVGAAVVSSQTFVNGIQLICMKVRDDGTLDTGDKYESEWIGQQLPAGKPTLLDGDGRRVIGYVTKRGGILNQFGLVLAKDK